METIINQLFWLWVPLSLIPSWLRIGLISFFVFLLLRPIIFTFIPVLLEIISQLFILFISLVSAPIMWFLDRFLSNRRKKGIQHVPVWIDLFEDLNSLLLKGAHSLKNMSKKRINETAKPKLKKGFRIAGLVSAIIIALAYSNNPNETYSKKWREIENWASVEKVQKDLKFDLSGFQQTVFASTELSKETIIPQENKKIFTLTPKYKAGGNIREEANDTSTILEVIEGEETVTSLNQKATDARGVIWYKVRAANGKIGWISSKIVEEK